MSLNRISLRFLLIVPFTVIIIVFMCVTGYLTYQNSQRAVNDVVTQLLNEITNRVIYYFGNFLHEPIEINRTNARALQLGFLDPTDSEMLRQYFWEQIHFHDQVTSIYFGNAEGGLVLSGREGADGSLYVINTENFKSGTFNKYATDGDGQPTEVIASVDNFDARTRPWYTGAIEKNGMSRTDPYVLFTGQDMAVATSLPVYDDKGTLLGVSSVDIFMSHADHYLQALEIGQSGQVYVVDQNGLLVTSSTHVRSFRRDEANSTWQRMAAAESEIPIVRHSALYLTETFGGFNAIHSQQELTFDVNGERYFVIVTPLSELLDWYIVVTIPENDFLGQIKAQNYTTLAITLIAMLLALGVGVFAVNQIRKPIDRLNKAADALAKGEWQQSIPVQGVDEVQRLAQSFNSMASQLRGAFEVLEERVKERTAELQTSKLAAESASRAKSEFLSNMSHELRTPLNVILGFTEILKQNKNVDPGQVDGLDAIYKSGHHLLTLINDILDLAKVEAGKLELYSMPVLLIPFLEGIIQLMRMRAEKRHLRLMFTATMPLPEVVMVDDKRLRQILLNLLTNAIKFTNEGQVELLVQQISEDPLNQTVDLRFQVCDTGIGIPEDKFEQIFKPFEQLGDATQRVEGTGLGLNISYNLVKAMGGDLKVSSRVGGGSTFWFDLTLSTQAILVESSTPGVQVQGYAGNRRTIMIADDQRSNRKVLVGMLEPLGFNVITAENGEQLVACLEEAKPDLILTDLVMPVMSGIEAIQQIRARYGTALPVIAVSASDLNRKDELHGVDDFLVKPIEFERLLEVLQKHMRLNWVYRSAELVAVGQESAVETVITPPPMPVLLELWELVKRGNLRRLNERAADLRDDYPAFAQKIEYWARLYDENNLITFIQQFLEQQP